MVKYFWFYFISALLILAVIDAKSLDSNKAKNSFDGQRSKRQSSKSIMPYYLFNPTLSLPAHEYGCPNKRFLTKHIDAKNSDDPQSVLFFASQTALIRAFAATSPTNKNTVFNTDLADMSYEIAATGPNKGLCCFGREASKYQCTKTRKALDFEWTCENRGSEIACHDPSNGHYSA